MIFANEMTKRNQKMEIMHVLKNLSLEVLVHSIHNFNKQNKIEFISISTKSHLHILLLRVIMLNHPTVMVTMTKTAQAAKL